MTRSALTLLLIALTPLVAACQDQEARPIVRPVLSVVAHEQTTETIGPFAGSIEPRYTVALGFQVFGRLVARDVNVGDVVKKGARLAALDPAVQMVSVRSAQASLASAEAQLATALAAEERQRTLLDQRVVAPAQFEMIQRNEQLANPFFGQIVIVTKGVDARDRVQKRLSDLARAQFVGVDVLVHALELGPPVGRPVQYRVSGPDIQTVRSLAQKFAGVIEENRHIGGITYDWNEPEKVLQIKVAQDRARQLGISSQDVSSMLNSVVGGSVITQVRDSIYLVDVIGRARDVERSSIETYPNLQVPGRNNQSIPLPAFASIGYGLEQPLVWRRARLPTITVKATLVDDVTPATVVSQLEPKVDDFIRALLPNYSVTVGGSVEESGKSERPIAAVVPLMLFLMATIMMLQSFQKLFLVVSVAPLGLIGVVAALLPTGTPLGFVAILGVLALIGIIIRNSVILVTQIDDFHDKGLSPWDAVVEATGHRMRPILLTAAAPSLGMIPIAGEVFWGPMAYAMIGGIIVATLLTLFFLPALYVAWYRIKEPEAARA
jgi:multidrug efflux pump subunit AcrB